MEPPLYLPRNDEYHLILINKAPDDEAGEKAADGQLDAGVTDEMCTWTLQGKAFI